MDCSPPGSSVHGILQARILEWISFSRGSSWPRNWTQVSGIAERFFTNWAMREAQEEHGDGISSVQSLSRVWLFATPWTTARQASLSISNSWSPLKPMSIESVMPSTCLILRRPFSSCPQSFPASGSFQMSQLFASGGQSIAVSASTSVCPMNTQDWSPLGWTGWISLQSKGLSRVFSNTTVQKHQFSSAQLSSQSNSHIHTWLLEKTIALYQNGYWLNKPVCFTCGNVLLSYVNETMYLLENLPFFEIHVHCFMALDDSLVPVLSQNACCAWRSCCNSLSWEAFPFSN